MWAEERRIERRIIVEIWGGVRGVVVVDEFLGVIKHSPSPPSDTSNGNPPVASPKFTPNNLLLLPMTFFISAAFVPTTTSSSSPERAIREGKERITWGE